MKKKFISGMLAGAIILGNGVATYANTNQDIENNVEVEQSVSVEEKTEYDQDTLEQLTMAVEEMRITKNELDAGSLDTDRVMRFATTAIDRLRGLNTAELDKIPNGRDHYNWVTRTYIEVNNKVEEIKAHVLEQLTYAVEEMRIAVTELDNGSTDYERILTFAATALERVRPLVINQGSELYGNYRWVIDTYGEVLKRVEEAQTKPEEGYDEYTLEQLTYAVEEMRIAVTELDGGSTDYKRILTFAATALERVRPLDEEEINKIDNGYDNYRWVIDMYGYVVNKIESLQKPDIPMIPLEPSKPVDEEWTEIGPSTPIEKPEVGEDWTELNPSTPIEKPEAGEDWTELNPSTPIEKPEVDEDWTELNPSTPIKKPVVSEDWTEIKPATKVEKMTELKPATTSKLPQTGVESIVLQLGLISTAAGSVMLRKRK